MGGKKKALYDPFARLARYTCNSQSYSKIAAETSHPGDFTDTGITISPALPRTEVGLSIQFRCSVNIVEGDVIVIHLPNFKGNSRVLSLEMRPHPDKINLAQHFQAYWSGDEKLKGRGKNGVPAKQQLLLRCIRRVEEQTMVLVGVPHGACIVSPDKLALNSTKIRIEGRVKNAENGRIPKMPFASCTEIKKKTLIEEIEAYSKSISGVVEGAGLSKEMRFVGEELCAEEVDQIADSIEGRRPFKSDLKFFIGIEAFHAYEDAGGFVKEIMEGTVRFLKERDPLAVHKEVARNWNVKIGAVVILEDLVACKYAGFYPKLSRLGILVVYLLMMTPGDVMRTFPGLTTAPKMSIYQELICAYRMRSLIGSSSDPTALPSRSEEILKKWNSVVAILLTATTLVDEADPLHHEEDVASKGATQRQATVTFAEADLQGGAPAVQSPYMCPPPLLYVGLKDLPSGELQYLKSLAPGDLYMFPNFVVAREEYKPLEELAAREAAIAHAESLAAAPQTPQSKKKAKKGKKSNSPAATASSLATARTEIAAEFESHFSIPDNAIVFKIRKTVECLEMTDISASPANREWLLPFSSSFRVVSVTVEEELNDLVHVVLDMQGSLSGVLQDECIPDGDRAVARMVTNKVLQETEKAEGVTPAIALITYYNIKLSMLRRLHPPTLLREQYLTHFRENKRASEAKQAIESGKVVWEVCVSPAQQLEEGVIKPSSWESMPRRYALIVENLFRTRSKQKFVWNEVPGGLTSLHLQEYTADYMGKGPRPIRRVVCKCITHEVLKSSITQLQAEMEATKKTLKKLTAELGANDKKK